MRRFIVLLSVLILAFLVAACGNSSQARMFRQMGQTEEFSGGIDMESLKPRQ